MNSLSNTSIIRQKAVVETVFELKIPASLYGPREDANGNLYICSQVGEIIKFNDKGEYVTLQTLSGQPTSIVFIPPADEDENQSQQDNHDHALIEDQDYYFADVANSVIYEKKSEEDVKVLIKAYQGNPLKGPTSLAYSRGDHSLLFCDGGYFESTSLNRPHGSIYQVELESNTIKPLLQNCLAYPSDIFLDLNCLGYVTETFANRILRISQNPIGIYHFSVFYVFNGRVGPTAVTCDENGNVYVSRFEYQSKENDIDGIISVINKEGYLIGELIIPKTPEIVGLHIPKTSSRSDSVLYFTTRYFSGVKKIKIGNFSSDIDKAQDNYKIY